MSWRIWPRNGSACRGNVRDESAPSRLPGLQRKGSQAALRHSERVQRTAPCSTLSYGAFRLASTSPSCAAQAGSARNRWPYRWTAPRLPTSWWSEWSWPSLSPRNTAHLVCVPQPMVPCCDLLLPLQGLDVLSASLLRVDALRRRKQKYSFLLAALAPWREGNGSNRALELLPAMLGPMETHFFCCYEQSLVEWLPRTRACCGRDCKEHHCSCLVVRVREV
jgi:hypothetical protein